MWQKRTSAPESPRGGTSLAAVGSRLLRFGGFNGEELGGSVDVFDPDDNSWTSRPFTSGPGNRSVASFLPHPAFPTTKAILLFGEKSPSSDGHNKAGTFWSDIWTYDYENDQWKQMHVENAHVLVEGGSGWGAGTVREGVDGGEVVVWGGLNGRNERIGRGWRIGFSSS
jgi:Kelch motif